MNNADLIPMDVPILMYHHLVRGGQATVGRVEISVDQLVWQLGFLARHRYETVSFDRLFRILSRDEPKPRRMVLLTFDDGYSSFWELGLPVLQQYGMVATVFVPAGEIGGTNRWDRATGLPERQVMTAEELRQVAAAGMEIGSHGWNHRALPACSAAEAHEEIFASRVRLQELGFAADFFAYPYGKYSPALFGLLREAGYRGAVSLSSDAPWVTANPMAMRRIGIHPGITPLKFRLKLFPVYLRYVVWRGWTSK